MDGKKTLNLIDFFNSISIDEEDVSTDEERANGQLVVVVTYHYGEQSFITQKLYYKSIVGLTNVKKDKGLIKHFCSEVYWLDTEENNWPQERSDSDLEGMIIPEIIQSGDEEFRKFLLLLVRNDQSGILQQMTQDGRSARYYHNLENNNHWHDVINLIKAYIHSHGIDISEDYFKRLVFQWQDGKRASLSKKFENRSRAIIDWLQYNISVIQPEIMKKEIVDVLVQKKQIILQGPPGTGKTWMAKRLAEEMTKPLKISDKDIDTIIKVGLSINSATNYTQYVVDKITDKTVQLKLNVGSIYSPSKVKIIEAYDKKLWDGGQVKGNDPYEAAVAKYIYDNIGLEKYKIIQFHPAYSYEDFVRGISAKANGTSVEYKTENRTLAKFADLAHHNYLDSKKDMQQISREKWIESKLQEFAETIEISLEGNPKYALKNNIYITGVDDDAFRYKGDNWSSESRILFSDFTKLAIANISERKEIKDLQNISKHVLHRKTYYFSLLEKFKEFAKEPVDPVIEKGEVEEYKYVLIVDEINRANLPAVLGELIYALEYRDEKVTSLYELENGTNDIIIPSNLYIIGTMNTADRSVGHIDYAIRRRFAFIDVLPNPEPIKDFARPLFQAVSELFINNYAGIDWNDPKPVPSEFLAEDFRPEYVWIGHSYFITKEDGVNGRNELRAKLKYEIKPILKEYLKDGIFKDEKIMDKINNLDKSIS